MKLWKGLGSGIEHTENLRQGIANRWHAGSKLAKAKQLGVRVLTEDEFEQLLRGELE